MPGLAVAAGSLDGAPATAWLLERAARDKRTRTIVHAHAGLVVGCSAPAGYPLTVERADGVTCALEGSVYANGRETIAADLRRLASAFAHDPASARDKAEVWAMHTDGDFVLCLADDGARRALVVNDRLGRLPLYYARARGAAAIAREIKFVRGILGAGDADRLAIAQLLLFSFPLGSRTMHRDIRRLPDGSSVAIDAAGRLDVRRYHQWNFEALAQGADGRPGAAAELAGAFVECCGAQGRWAAGRPLVVAMSGGLDSRSAAAGFSRAGHPYACVTFESGRKGASDESATAALIAKTLGAPWRLYRLDRPQWNALAELAARCDGTTNVGMAFMEEFFARLQTDFGPDVVQITGDGGDRALPDLADLVPAKDRDAFVARRLDAALWPLETVARLVRLEPDDIVADVREHVHAYPERSPEWWAVRYMIADWGWGRIFSGEDRSRSYAWTITPFYCQSFFERAMRVPQQMKRDYALYARFLQALDPRVARLKKSNWGYAPTSPLVRLRGLATALQTSAPASLRKAIASVGAPRQRDANAARTTVPEFLAAIAKRPNGIFDRAALADVARRGLGKTQYHMLATALLYADGVWRESAG